MVLIDLTEHDLAVIKGGLNTLIKWGPESSEKNNVQGTIDHVQEQIDEILEWQKTWKEMNPVLKEEINVKCGFGLQYVDGIVNNLTIDDKLRDQLKKTIMRCELK